jgi:hypothetical protein
MVVGVINPSGVDVNHSTPFVVRWLKRCSPFAYAIEALCVGEYRGMQFEKRRGGLLRQITDLPKLGALAAVANGDQVLQALGLQKQTYQGAMHHLALLTVSDLILAWLGLMVHQLPYRRVADTAVPIPDEIEELPPASSRSMQSSKEPSTIGMAALVRW